MKQFRGGLPKTENRHIHQNADDGYTQVGACRRSSVSLSILLGFGCFSQKKLKKNFHLQLQ